MTTLRSDLCRGCTYRFAHRCQARYIWYKFSCEHAWYCDHRRISRLLYWLEGSAWWNTVVGR